jgi:hypothetical protein
VAASQRRTVPSSPAEASAARRSPPTHEVSAHTVPVWPVSGAPIGSPVAASQRRTVASSPAEASIARPSPPTHEVTAHTGPKAPTNR